MKYGKEIRKIVHIDEDKCNGCGLCVPACHEGAIQIVEGKARLLEDFLCDGLGDCLGECPEGAIRIEEREAEPFDEEAVKEHLAKKQLREESPGTCGGALPCGCPGSSVVDRRRPGEEAQARAVDERVGKGDGVPKGGGIPSALRQWPVQAALVPPHAPFLQGDKLLVAADCVSFAMGDFHQRLLAGTPLLVGCPKLDDAGRYVEKFAAILKQNPIQEITVAFMEVPCCSGMVRILQQAIQQSGKPVTLKGVKVSTTGEVVQEGVIGPRG